MAWISDDTAPGGTLDKVWFDSRQGALMRRTATIGIIFVTIVTLAIGMIIGELADGSYTDSTLAWTPAPQRPTGTPAQIAPKASPVTSLETVSTPTH